MKVVLIVFLGLLLSSCGEQTTSPVSNVVEGKAVVEGKKRLINSTSVEATSDGNAVVFIEGKDLIFKKGKDRVVLKDTYAVRHWLKIAGKHVYVFWWVKFDSHTEKNLDMAGKTLYVRASNDGGKTFGEVVTVNDSHGVLPDVDIVADEKGNVALVYLDERFSGFQIFTNSSSDGGKTWLANDFQLNHALPDADKQELDSDKKNEKPKTRAVTPSLKKFGNNIIAMWEQIEVFDGKKAVSIVSRVSSDFGKTWSDIEVIFRGSDRLSLEIKSDSDGDEVFMLAVLKEGLALFSKKNNEKWTRVKGLAPGTDKTRNVSYFKTAFDKSTLYVSYINVKGTDKKSWGTELLRFDRKSRTWKEGVYGFDALPSLSDEESRSAYQDIAVLEDGTIIVVWEDYRGVLPAVFMNYSLDGGNTWLVNPLPLVKVGLEHAVNPRLKTSGNTSRVYFDSHVYIDETKPEPLTREIVFNSPKSEGFKKLSFREFKLKSDDSASKSEIESRMKTLMDLRMDKTTNNMEQEWSFIDPIFRNKHRKISWMGRRDLFSYADYDIDSIEVKGNLAYVKGDTTFSLSSELAGAKALDKAQLKNIKQKYTVKWGWFNDNWYYIPENPTQSHLP